MAKYPWGEDAVPGSLVGAAMVLSALLVGVILAAAGPSGAAGVGGASVRELRGVALLTVAYVASFYSMLGAQIHLKMASASSEAHNIGERAVYNTLEQMFPFLLSLWLHAAFVNPATSVPLGWAYVALRHLYPMAYGFYGKFNLLAELVTAPNYTVIWWFLLAIVARCGFDVDLHRRVQDVSPLLLPVVAFGALFVCLFMFFGLGACTGSIIRRGDEWEKTRSAAAEPMLAKQ